MKTSLQMNNNNPSFSVLQTKSYVLVKIKCVLFEHLVILLKHFTAYMIELKCCEIHSKIGQWLKLYLPDRNQKVEIKL
jgi:hypothetical protein